jgi:hypothetical protein
MREVVSTRDLKLVVEITGVAVPQQYDVHNIGSFKTNFE